MLSELQRPQPKSRRRRSARNVFSRQHPFDPLVKVVVSVLRLDSQPFGIDRRTESPRLDQRQHGERLVMAGKTVFVLVPVGRRRHDQLTPALHGQWERDQGRIILGPSLMNCRENGDSTN